MSTLSNLTNTTGSSVTTLPSWYDQAQQNLVNQAQTSFANAPQLNQTVAQGAINTLQGPNNPFTQATNTLNTISSGAANPWITDASGKVSPNTSTAMGGLFQAQNQELNQLLPQATAGTEAGAIGSGNFGSLRGQTAVDTAKANAFAQLLASQNQAALQNQSTGTQAATGLGAVGQQGINTGMSVGQTQMTAPFQNTANLGNILASINAPQTVNTTQTPSTLASLTGLGTVVSGGLNSLFNGTATTPSLASTISKNFPGLASIFGSSSGSGTSTDTSGSTTVNNPSMAQTTNTGTSDSYTGPITQLSDGTYQNAAGQATDASGNILG